MDNKLALIELPWGFEGGCVHLGTRGMRTSGAAAGGRGSVKTASLLLGSMLLLLTVILVAAGCGKTDGVKGQIAKPVSKGKFTLVFTGSVLGELEDCGCMRNPRGGLARKATVIKSLDPSVPRLILNSGDTFFPAGPYGDLDGPDGAEVQARSSEILTNAKAMADAEKLIGMDAMAPGDTDLRFGLKTFNELATRAGIPVVSANLADNKTDQLLFSKYIIRKLGDLDVAVIGATGFVAAPAHADSDGARQPSAAQDAASKRRAMLGVKLPEGAGVKALPTVPAVTAAVAEAKKEGAEVFILLAHMSWADARMVVEEVDGLSFAIVSHDRRLNSVENINGVQLISGGFMGMQVGQLNVDIVKGDLKFRDLNEKATLERTVSLDKKSLKSYQDALASYGVDISSDASGAPQTGSDISGQSTSAQTGANSERTKRIEHYQKSLAHIQGRIDENTAKINELSHMDLGQFDNYMVQLIDMNRSVQQDPNIKKILDDYKSAKSSTDTAATTH